MSGFDVEIKLNLKNTMGSNNDSEIRLREGSRFINKDDGEEYRQKN